MWANNCACIEHVYTHGPKIKTTMQERKCEWEWMRLSEKEIGGKFINRRCPFRMLIAADPIVSHAGACACLCIRAQCMIVDVRESFIIHTFEIWRLSSSLAYCGADHFNQHIISV